MTRVFLGFAAAALWLPLVSYFTGGVYGQFWFVMTASFTLPLTVVLAIPLFFLWRRRITFWRCLLAGLAIGLVGALAFLAMTNLAAALNWSPGLIGAGVLSSIVFWAVGIWNNGALAGPPNPGVSNAAI